MAESPPGDRIFISYRREETAYAAGWLFDRLADRFGSGQVFKDVDSIELGDDFVEVITNAVGSTDVLLALIGDDWLTIADDRGWPRLDDPDDFVRLEIEAALARKVRLIPILVDGARMPRAEELPPSLAPLARRQALELSPSRFDFDTSRLLKVLDKTLAEERMGKDDTASIRAPAAKAPDPSKIEVQKAPDQRVRTPSIPPGASAGPGWGRRLFARRRILIGAGVGIAAVLLALLVAAIISNPSEAITFVDDFSSREHGWPDTQAGGHYKDGAYYMTATRERVDAGFMTVIASPRNASSAANLSIKVDAHSTGSGTAEEGAGYGIFCRGDDPDNLYAFTIWLRAASIAKHSDGDYEPLSGDDSDVHSEVEGTSPKRLEAVCTSTSENGKSVVDLEFWVDDEMILKATDPKPTNPTSNPFESGSFGLQATLGPKGEIGDTLEVEFDNFEVRED